MSNYHTLLFDGVFFADDANGALDFRPLPPPTDEEVGVVLARIATRVQRLLTQAIEPVWGLRWPRGQSGSRWFEASPGKPILLSFRNTVLATLAAWKLHRPVT